MRQFLRPKACSLGRTRLPRIRLYYQREPWEPPGNVAELPFVVGVLADLSGRPLDPLPPESQRRLLEIDVDNFENRLKSCKPRVAFRVPNTLTGEGNLSVEMTFESMDDFSPTAIARKVPSLAQLLQIRTELSTLLSCMEDSNNLEQQVARFLNDPDLMKALIATPVAETDDAAIPVSKPEQSETPVKAPALSDFSMTTADREELIEQLQRPIIDPVFNPVRPGQLLLALRTLCGIVLENAEFVAGEARRTVSDIIADADRKLAAQVNLILHHDDFTALEGTWRGLCYLVNNTETNEMLKIKVLNISKSGLRMSLETCGSVAWDQRPVFAMLHEEGFTVAGEPFGCLIGDYYFDHSPEDVTLLGNIAQMAAAIHAPFIAGVAPSVFQMDSWQELAQPRNLTRIFQTDEYAAWRSLRESEDSRYIGLTMPRFLARLPYGAKTMPVGDFAFDEDTEGTNHNKYVMSNAAFAMGVNITRAFMLYGWCARIYGIESGGIVGGLPVHTFPMDDGGVDMHCPTEIAITNRREAELAQSGFMPLCHYKDTDYVVFMGAQSLHKPVTSDDLNATVNANLAARLPYLFAICRFAHYLKCMVRDMCGRTPERTDVERYLNHWIAQYVLNPGDTNQESKAWKPLAAAQIEITEWDISTGVGIAKLCLRPRHLFELPMTMTTTICLRRGF